LAGIKEKGSYQAFKDDPELGEEIWHRCESLVPMGSTWHTVPATRSWGTIACT